MQWTQANRPLHYAYKEVVEINGVDGTYDLDSPVPRMSVSFQLNHANLTPFSGSLEIGSDAAKQIGRLDGWFAEQACFVARDFGQKLETSMFGNIVRTALTNNRHWALSDTDSKQHNTIAIVSWTGGETCGLYSPIYGKVDANRLFELEKLQNGSMYKNERGILTYGAIFKTTMGLLLANKRQYAVVTHVDPGEKGFAKSFPEKMSEILDECLVNEYTTILMSNRLRTAVGCQYTTKATENVLVKFDEKCNLSVCGVPVISSANLPTRVDWSKMGVQYKNDLDP